MSTVALNGWRRGWSLPDRRPIAAWAAEHVKLGGGYARQGAFDIRTCRHLEEPFAAAQDESVREITCRAAIQTLKTLYVEIYSLWALANESGPMMWTQQDEDSAKEHVKGRYRNLLRNCDAVAQMLPRSRHEANTCEIYFGDFYLLVNGANINNLQSKSIRHKLNSECWLWKQGLLTQARRRVSAYARDGISKIINESQGSYAGDDFDKLWGEGTQQVWSVECFGCKKPAPLLFFAPKQGEAGGVKWDTGAKGDDGKWDEARVRASTRWICPNCGHEHDNSQRTRARWNAAGSYSPARPGADLRHRSFGWNALLAEDMGQLAVEFLSAHEFKKRGLLQPTKDFYMQRLALPWRDEAVELVASQTIKQSAYLLSEVATAPAAKLDNEVKRLQTIDRQRDHFWCVVRAWRLDGSSRLLWRGRAQTSEQLEEIRQRYGVDAQLTCEDAQYSTAHVYEDCVRFGWTALHGSGDDEFPHLLRNGKRVKRFYSPIKETQVPGGVARYMFWASDPVKDILGSLVSGASHEWEIAADVGEEYLRQLRGEVKRERVNKKNGRQEWRWVRIGPNHYWDCEAMQVAVALALRLIPSPDTLTEKADTEHTAQ